MNLAAIGPGGTPLVPLGAHIRQASPHTNDGARLLRRGYSYANGIDPQTGEFDAGLFFICFQRDPRTQFVPIQRRFATNDDLSQYVTHTASALFACPPGIGSDGDWSTALFS